MLNKSLHTDQAGSFTVFAILAQVSRPVTSRYLLINYRLFSGSISKANKVTLMHRSGDLRQRVVENV